MKLTIKTWTVKNPNIYFVKCHNFAIKPRLLYLKKYLFSLLRLYLYSCITTPRATNWAQHNCKFNAKKPQFKTAMTIYSQMFTNSLPTKPVWWYDTRFVAVKGAKNWNMEKWKSIWTNQSSHQFSIWVQSGLLFWRHDICILLKWAYADKKFRSTRSVQGFFRVLLWSRSRLKTLTRSQMVTWQRNILAPMVLRVLCYYCNIFNFFS